MIMMTVIVDLLKHFWCELDVAHQVCNIKTCKNVNNCSLFFDRNHTVTRVCDETSNNDIAIVIIYSDIARFSVH